MSGPPGAKTDAHADGAATSGAEPSGAKSAFTFDAAGEVFIPDPRFPTGATRIRWSDLSPFTQGYVEAAFASLPRPTKTIRARAGNASFTAPARAKPLRFDRLHPETLAAMIRDCEAFGKTWRAQEPERGFATGVQGGRDFWWLRNNRNLWDPPFPPLTLSLGDDGKVYAREAGQ